MADKFECDKCGKQGPMAMKRGRLIVQELNNGMPHPSLYNRKAELCESCMQQLKTSMRGTPGPASMAESQGICAEASLAVLDMPDKKKKGGS